MPGAGLDLLAIRERGLSLTQDGERLTVHPAVSGSAHDLGEQDVLVLAVKAHGIAAAVRAAAPMIGPRTMVLPMVNGVPWWFLDGTGQPPLRSVDPNGAIGQLVPSTRIVGCVVHASCRLADLGDIRDCQDFRV